MLQAKPEHAGKTVKCPTCGQRLTVPESGAAASPAAIQVTCQCGKVLKVKSNLAGKKVKCPGCGLPLAIHVPSREITPMELDGPGDDPLGLGALADADPLGIGDSEGVPFGPQQIGATYGGVGSFRVRYPKPSAAGGIGRATISLRDLAGWVAVCFGGYQALVCGTSILWTLVVCVRGGSLIPLIGFGTVLPALFLLSECGSRSWV